MQCSYFSTTQKETVEGTEDTKSNCSEDECDDQTEISEGQLLNNTAENDNSSESSVMSSFGDESTDPLRTLARKFSNIDFLLKILPLKDDELVMSEM